MHTADSEWESALPVEQLEAIVAKYRMLWEPTADREDFTEIALPGLLRDTDLFDCC